MLVVAGTLGPADLPRLRSCLDQCGRGPVVCDVGGLTCADAVALDVLARLQLHAGRSGRRLVLRAAPAELLELIALAGLEEALPATPRAEAAGRRAGTAARSRGRT